MRSWILLSMCVTALGFSSCVYHSPGTLYESSLEPLLGPEIELRDQLKRDVVHLASAVGPRNSAQSVKAVLDAERWIVGRLSEGGIEARRDEFDITIAHVANVEATFHGTRLPEEVLVVGGHYDTVSDSPGANDNASGVAVLLALAEHLKRNPPERTVRVLFFVNEEAPFSGGIQMGSRVYAERCRQNEDRIVAMICVDGVGCYSNERGSQNYPWLFGWSLPSRANFIAFGSNRENRPLLDLTVATFQRVCRFPSIGVGFDAPMMARSDQGPFIWQGYPAISMSDTAEFRDATYHTPEDTPTHLNYEEMARMASGFLKTVHALAAVTTVFTPSLPDE